MTCRQRLVTNCGVGLRRGFSLVELLVSLAIIGVLLALIVPALSAARESARATACRNNLRQVALAHENYVDAGRSGLPFVHYAPALMPYLERAELRERPGGAGPSGWESSSVWLCPSDLIGSISRGNYSYLPSVGLSLDLSSWLSGGGESGVSGALVVNADYQSSGRFRFLRAEEFGDGASRTIRFTEKLLEPTDNRPPAAEDRIGVWFSAGPPAGQLPTRRFAAQACLGATERAVERRDLVVREGLKTSLLVGGVAALQPPNGRTCYLGAPWPVGGVPSMSGVLGGAAATSRHRGFVAAAFADGHVEAVSDEIDLAVWRDLNNVPPSGRRE